MAGNIASRRGTGKHFDFAAQLRDPSRFQKHETAEIEMTIKVGDKLPDGKLSESTEYDAAAGCPINPKDLSVAEAAKARRSRSSRCRARIRRPARRSTSRA